MHGDEPKSVSVAQQLIRLLETETEIGRASDWVIVPVVNPDGYERRRRRNANAVDINRNFPTRNWTRTSRRSRMFGGDKPASEPETRAIIKIIELCLSEPSLTRHSGLRPLPRYVGTPAKREVTSQGPARSLPIRRLRSGLGSALHDCPRSFRIIALHTINGKRQCNNYDGPARAIATAMHRRNGYPVVKSIGYPTPGSLGTWAGHERKIPIVTLELPSHHSPKRCWEENHLAFFC